MTLPPRHVSKRPMPASALPKARFTPARPPGTDDAPQVETERIDPTEILAPRPPTRSFTGDFMEHAEPIEAPKHAAPPPEVEHAPPQAQRAEPSKPVLDLLVTDDLITRLEKELGFSVKLHDVELEVDQVTIEVTVRRPEYDDYLWTMAVIERKLAASEDQAILMTDAQREQVMAHYVAARCVVKIRGQWTWDVFKVADQIAAVVPGWAKDPNPARLPDFMKGTLAVSTFALFRRLHPDLLFALNRATKLLEEATGEDEGAGEDPTQGA